MGGIWIRSQDKSLYYCKGFDAPDKKNYAIDKNKAYAIVGYVSGEMQPILGWYETETRALQVLDEIQAVIVEYINTISYNITQASNGQFDRIYPIYVMPAE